ncbi:NAD-dependent epimerase/dehydratase family protein [Paenibacillus sp. OV219]|uniref:NAD-dependent epimerase/dehydratase family protein n=1 Tax=Paenibacillus sp. OV219 TaxID=1884377 RepID=UPI0008BB59AE|nr:NAD-dependent epimerase/dehydratase family protein [Paenibacillus sp. OV219]SEO73968.1 Nucleoside-diphosphate-sugar epimerase [Paenibacillus sp. OV219]
MTKRVLIIGGTGLISTAITKQLLARSDVEVWHYNRGLGNQAEVSEGVRTIHGDRTDYARFEAQMAEAGPFDGVIDMIGFKAEEAESAVRAFHGRVGHYIYCSTVDVYSKQGNAYPVAEDGERNASPSFPYAYNKVLSENILFAAHDAERFPVTIIRPAQTYGGSGTAVPSVADGNYQMKRLREGRPIIVHGDGMSIWVACHRDDVARAFVNAIGNEVALGKAYNVTGEEWMTYDRYWRIVAQELGVREPSIVHIPTDLLGKLLPKRAEWCVENFRYNNIYDNSAARRDLDFRYTVTWEEGIRDVIRVLDESGAIEAAGERPWYDALLTSWSEAECLMEVKMVGMDD